MSQSRKACVVLIGNEDGSFSIMDASGRLVAASDVAELGVACAAVLDRDDLPEVTTPTPFQIHMEAAAARAADYVGRAGGQKARALAPLIAPAIKGVSNTVARFRDREKREANARQEGLDLDHRESRSRRRRRLMELRGGGGA